MKKSLFIIGVMLALMVVIAVPSAAFAADDSKTAVVDFAAVIDGSDAGKHANAELAEFIKTKQAAAEEKGKLVSNLKMSFEEQVANLSPEDKKAKQEELVRSAGEYQALVRESNAEVQRKAAELKSVVVNEIKEVLKKIAQEEKYVMILDSAVVPYYDNSVDISAKVIQKYNEEKKSK